MTWPWEMGDWVAFMLKIMLVFFNKSRLKYVEDSCRHLEGFCTRLTLQLPGVIRMAGEEEDLVVFREGSDGLDGGGAAGERGLTIDD